MNDFKDIYLKDEEISQVQGEYSSDIGDKYVYLCILQYIGGGILTLNYFYNQTFKNGKDNSCTVNMCFESKEYTWQRLLKRNKI